MLEWYRRFLVVLTIAARVYTQSSDVTQCVEDYQWSINALGQTPCLVGSYLETLCSANPIAVDALPEGNHYIGPSLAIADPCSCNSVTYSMISACAGCQDKLFLNFSAWTMYCRPVVPIGQFPRTVPNITQIPPWAFLNISLTNGTFSETQAKKVATKQPKVNITSSSSAAISTLTSSPLSQSNTTDSTPSQSISESKVSSGLGSGAIAGITVGVLTAVIIVLLALFWMKLRSKRRDDHTPGYNPLRAGSSHSHGILHSKPPSRSASVITPYTYSASEGARQQAPSDMSALYTTVPRMQSVDNLPPSKISPVVSTTLRSSTLTSPCGYSGAPEI